MTPLMTETRSACTTLRLALPKGRMQDGVLRLLADAGIRVDLGSRAYRPTVSWQGVEAKLLKPQNIIEMLQAGTQCVGFAGADWVAELEADVVELLDTGLNPVRLVAAAPTGLLEDGRLPARPLVVASEYEGLTRRWMAESGIEGRFVRSFGATEVFPPEDADCIIDNTATGATLVANGLTIVEEVMRSSTRLYASRAAMETPELRGRIDHLVLLVRSVLDARSRVMLEVNVPPDRLEAIAGALPSMREPTISPLHDAEGYAVKAAIPREGLPDLIPLIKSLGGTDLVITRTDQIIP